MGPLLLLALLASAQDFTLPDDDSELDLNNKKGVKTASVAGTQPAGTWGGNRIYVWFLPSSKAHFSPAQAKAVIEAGNAFLQRMSVLTRMTGLIPPQTFDASGLDERDIIVLLGEKTEVMDTGRKSGILKESDAWLEHDWLANKFNPEIGPDKQAKRPGFVLVGASATKDFTKELGGKATAAQAAALLAIHGAGHVSGMGHLDDKSFMDDGALLAANISGKASFIMNGVWIKDPQLTPIDDHFSAALFDKLPDTNYSRKYAPQNTQRKAWVKLFGSRAPSGQPPICSANPKWCL